jgi:hypothetical protein
MVVDQSFPREARAEHQIRTLLENRPDELRNLGLRIGLAVAVDRQNHVGLEIQGLLETSVHGRAQAFAAAVDDVSAALPRDLASRIRRVVGDQDLDVVRQAGERLAYFCDHSANGVFLVFGGNDDYCRLALALRHRDRCSKHESSNMRNGCTGISNAPVYWPER